MRYELKKNMLWVVGRIWMPSVVCGQAQELRDYDVENARDDDGKITRESMERWVCLHCGDFSEIIDFKADFEAPEGNVVIEWATPDGEEQYMLATSSEGD